ncbi:MAG: hypothetical protein WBC33_04835 [Conexibacter sp.]
MTSVTGCTIEQFTATTGIPVSFLDSIGIKEVQRKQRRAVRLSEAATYLAPPSEDGLADDEVVERKGGGSTLFGLDSLDLIGDTGSVYLVADEIEALTLRLHGLPALAVPAAARWAEGWPALDEAAVVFVVFSGAGSEPPAWVAEAPFRDRARLLHLAMPRVANLLHRNTPSNFRAAWKSVCGTATSWSEYEATRRAERRAEAATRCADLVMAPDILSRVATDLGRAGFAGSTREAKLLYLVATSRLLERPISTAVKGPSSAGKSFVVKSVLEFFPKSAFLTMTAMSPKALVYSKEPLAHRVLVLYEADGMGSTAELILRSLLSEGHIVYDTVASEDGSAPEGKHIERDGPTSFITTTTRVALHRENETRFFSVTVSDSAEHTHAILRALADEAAHEVDYTRWHALQEFLASGEHEVTIPFGMTLAGLVTGHAVRLRRDFGALLSLVRTHALLHQETRDRDDRNRIVATIADYAAVYGLVHEMFAETAEEAVPADVRETVEAIQQMGPSALADGDGVTIRQITTKLASLGVALDRSSVQRRVSTAIELGFLLDRTGGGRGKAKQIVLGDWPGYGDGAVLPTPAELEEVCAYACTPA